MRIAKQLLTTILVCALVFTILSTDYVHAASNAEVKVTFNANGGKIGTAKTKTVSITKGKKLSTKLPKASNMKRSGYTFKGWYTAKKGGKIISSKTIINKKITYYAQWNKATIVGVWLGRLSSSSDGWRYVKFYSDGTFRFQMPRNGYNGFNVTKDKANNKGKNIWGSYTFNGKTGSWKYDSAAVRANIKLESDGGLDLGSAYSKFYRCASVDGYRFSGSYTSLANPKDPWISEPGDRPVIKFKSDGTFVDRGLFKWVDYLNDGETPDKLVPGSGTYSIKNYSLILKYSDGRTIQKSFSFKMGPKSKDASGYVLICDGFPLNKMP